MIEEIEEKTIGLTPCIYAANQAIFHVSAGVPVKDALQQASDLLCLAKSLSHDAAFTFDSDRYAWAAHYLTCMGKAIIDDVVKAVTPRPVRLVKPVAR